jgi:hypothetical protein
MVAPFLLVPFLVFVTILLVLISDKRGKRKLLEKAREKKEAVFAQLSARAGERFAASQKAGKAANAGSENRIREAQCPIQETAP